MIFDQNLAELAAEHLRKGAPVYVEGEMRTRKWTDQGGQERFTTEVVLPRFRGQLILLPSGRSVEEAPPDAAGSEDFGLDEEIPF